MTSKTEFVKGDNPIQSTICTKCEPLCGFRFDRPYRPEDWIEGDPTSPIWIIGLNPRSTELDHTSTGINHRSLEETRSGFAKHAKKIGYFKIFARVSPALYSLLGTRVAHTDLVKCASSSWPPPNTSDATKSEILMNCSSYLRVQIQTHRPQLLICNGADVCRFIRTLLPPPSGTPINAPNYVSSAMGDDVVVVMTGFLRQLDNFNLRRIGLEIEALAHQAGVSLKADDA